MRYLLLNNKAGKDGFNGTAHVIGTAHATGDWSVKKSETALLGELGRETIVRNGRYFTVGDNGAEFAQVRQTGEYWTGEGDGNNFTGRRKS